MAVWQSPSYKTTIPKILYEHEPTLMTQVFGTRIAAQLSPHTATSQMDDDTEWLELASRCGWRDPVGLGDEATVIAKVVNEAQQFRYGTKAVHMVVEMIWRGSHKFKEDVPWDLVESLTTRAIELITPSTQVTPAKFIEKCMYKDDRMDREFRRLMSAAETCKFVKGGINNRERGDEPEQYRVDGKKVTGNHVNDYIMYGVGGLILFSGTGEHRGMLLLLASEHWDQVIGMLTRLANAYGYASRSWYGDQRAISAFERQVGMLMGALGTKGKKLPFVVAKAFHKAKALCETALSNSLLPGVLADQEAEYTKLNLQQVVDWRQVLANVQCIPFDQALDLLNLYRFIAPPDFDITECLGVMHKLHSKPRRGGADSDASPAMAAVYEKIKTERKVNLSQAVKRLTGAWPIGLPVPDSANMVKAKQAEQWTPRAILPYRQFGEDLVELVKDKATVPGSIDEFMRSRKPSESYLLWYMKTGGAPGTIAALNAYSSNSIWEDNYAAVAYKPESHKEKSRLFYMAPPMHRMILSEHERNLAEVCKFYPGSLMGMSPAAKETQLRKVMDVYDVAGLDDEKDLYDFTVFLVTFDLTKFSARASPGVTREYHQFWADVFGRDDLASLWRIGCTGEVVHGTHGLKMRYKNAGSDLEGFRGRMMTMMHCDILAAALRECKQQGHVVGRASLAAFIDDGTFKVACPGSGAVAVAHMEEMLKIICTFYEAAGQELHPNKCIVSTTHANILSDTYFNGVKVPAGLKAAMRLAPNYENPACAISEDLDAIFAGSQGVAKAGGEWFGTWVRYIEASLLVIVRWARRFLSIATTEQLAFMLFTPKSYGGFGLMGPIALFTTAVKDATEEGFGILNRIGRFYPTMRARVKAIVSSMVIQRDNLSILRDPLRVRHAGPVIVENRLTMEIVRWLEAHADTYMTFMSAYQDVKLREHAAGVADAIMSQGSVSIAIISEAWKATPLHYVEAVVGKFKRSATIIGLIGGRKVGQIRNKNREDIRSMFMHWM